MRRPGGVTTTGLTSVSAIASETHSINRPVRGLWLAAGLLLSSLLWAAEESPRTAFLKTVFADSVPQPAVLWMSGTVGEEVRKILGHKASRLRQRYWRQGDRSAWVLEEIGKERLITAGIVVGSEGIERVQVLRYRESRGGEIRYPFFTRQYHGARLDAEKHLDRHIDGISGATLSVRAMTRMTRLALYLHSVVTRDAP